MDLTPNAHDVARLAGVSQSAVSRAFTPGASISKATRRKVELAAMELGYRPNLMARSLITRRSNLIGVGMGNLANPFYAELLSQASARLEEAGCRTVLLPADRNGAGDTALRVILSYGVDALLLASTHLSSGLARECRRAGVPVVLMNRASGEPGVATVTGENKVGAAAIAKLFVSAGHRRLAFVAGVDDSSTSQEREQSFSATLAASGIPAPLRVSGQFDYEMTKAATRELLGRSEPPDAIFFANDYMALAGMEVARSEFNLSIGRDLSIAGFDDIPMASWPCFQLTTYVQPIIEMVERAVEILLAMRDESGDVTRVTVGGRLVIRSSVRPSTHQRTPDLQSHL